MLVLAHYLTYQTFLRPFQTSCTRPEVEWDDSDVYDFSHRERGMMIIINNEHFKGHSPRPGSGEDVASLEETFSQLGFTVTTYHNQTQQQMRKIFKKGDFSLLPNVKYLLIIKFIM